MTEIDRLPEELVEEIWLEGASELRFGFATKDMSFGSVVRDQRNFVAVLVRDQKIAGFMDLEFVGVFKGQTVYRATQLYPEDDLNQFSEQPRLLLLSSQMVSSLPVRSRVL
ncbi:hypothetical protein ACLBWS_17870 [Brucellaceae bacterium D45D]